MVENEKKTLVAVGFSDDDFSLLEKSLKKSNFACLKAAISSDIVTLIEANPVGLVLLDSDSGGASTVRLIDSLASRFPDTSVIAALSKPDSKRADSLIAAGADDIIAKPLDSFRLIMATKTVIERHRKLRETKSKNEDLTRQLERKNIEYANVLQELDQSNIDTIKTFVGLLETRYRYLGSHSKRVATFSRALSERYELNDRIRYEIEIGALLHDIGKIPIPDMLLQKTTDYFSISQLTQKELRVVQKHPVIGQEAVEMLEMLKHVGAYIRHHHERFDGGGYPDGLKGRYIPLGARIITVTDAYDRIVLGVDKRLQKSALELFLRYIDKQKGIIFDPEAVEYLIDYIHLMEDKKDIQEKRIKIDRLESGMVLARDIHTTNGVLLTSQYEMLTPKDITRLKLFHNSRTIPGSAYIFGKMNVQVVGPQENQESQKKPDGLKRISLDTVLAKVDSAKELKTLPSIYTSVMSKLSDPESTRSDIAQILRQDQVIVTKLLRLVNSPLFGFSRKITSVEDAIPLMGFNEIRNIVTSLSVIKLIDTGKPSDGFDRVEFWKHSIGVAVICEMMARNIGVNSGSEYFTAGLLHDIGRLALDQLYPVEFDQLFGIMKDQAMFLRQAEREIFGCPHQQIGEYLLDKWRLPDVLCDAVKNHHSPMDSTVDPLLVSAVHVSDIFAHMLHIGSSGEAVVPRLDSFAERKLGITISDFDMLIPDIEDKLKDSEDILSLGD